MVIEDLFSDVADTRKFGLKVARWSPLLASGLCAAALGLWATLPAPPEYWLAEFGLGVVSSPLVIKLYRTGDSRYAGAYGLLIGTMVPLLHTAMFASMSGPFVVYGGIPLLAGVAVVIASVRRHLIEVLEHTLDRGEEPALR